jgi:hypothetical protein
VNNKIHLSAQNGTTIIDALISSDIAFHGKSLSKNILEPKCKAKNHVARGSKSGAAKN